MEHPREISIPSDQPPKIPDSSSLIGILPTDLFIAIIALVIDRKSRNYRYEDLQSLRLVSKRWREVLDATPSFWNTIRCAASSTWIKLCLERSKDSPLAIRWSLDPASLGLSNPDRDALLVPQAARWKILSLISSSRWGRPGVVLEGLRSHLFPALDELYISGLRLSIKPSDIFIRSPPHLRRLFINSIPIAPTSAIFHSGTLEHLYIRNSLTADQVTTIFLGNPNLVVAYIATRSIIGHSPPPPVASRILLPMLKKLRLKMEPAFACHILRHLHVSKSTQIALHLDLDGLERTQPPALENFTRHVSSYLSNIPGMIKHIVLRLGRHGADIITDSGRLDSMILSQWEDFTPTVRSLLQSYQFHHEAGERVPTLVVKWRDTTEGWFDPSSMPNGHHTLIDLLDDKALSPTVISISLSVSASATQHVLEFLSRAPEPWPCPNLEDVKIRYDPETLKEILVLSRLRCTSSGVPHEGRGVGPLQVYVDMKRGEACENLQELDEAGVCVQGEKEGAAEGPDVFPYVGYRLDMRREDPSHFDWLKEESDFVLN